MIIKMKIKIIFLVTFFLLFNSFTLAELNFENKKKSGGPKSDYVLERKDFNFSTSVKDKNKNWVVSKETGEIVRYGVNNYIFLKRNKATE